MTKFIGRREERVVCQTITEETPFSSWEVDAIVWGLEQLRQELAENPDSDLVRCLTGEYERPLPSDEQVLALIAEFRPTEQS